MESVKSPASFHPLVLPPSLVSKGSHRDSRSFTPAKGEASDCRLRVISAKMSEITSEPTFSVVPERNAGKRAC